MKKAPAGTIRRAGHVFEATHFAILRETITQRILEPRVHLSVRFGSVRHHPHVMPSHDNNCPELLVELIATFPAPSGN